MKENYRKYYYTNGGAYEWTLPYKIRVSHKVRNFHQFKFWLFSLGRFCTYEVLDGDKVIATAEVTAKFFIFQFVKHGGLHIGPCQTNPDYRNKGIYTNLLKKICSDYKGKTLYIAAHKTNLASLRGIEKAGFTPFAEGYDSFGIYRVGRYI